MMSKVCEPLACCLKQLAATSSKDKEEEKQLKMSANWEDNQVVELLTLQVKDGMNHLMTERQ